ncbi:uncharacterized protein [Haliotis cracherodii]|uniref:uncharacterized protein n=1 Tax=Haliotis cracherodii TaxID=6455 RepID=UPI0039E830E2
MSAAHDVVYAEVDTRTALSATFLNVSTMSRSKWSKDGKELDPVGQRTEDQIIGYRLQGHQVNVSGSRLSRTWMTTSSDFGYYYVTACTRGGCTSAFIELKQLARPQPPIQFQVVANFTDGFWFTWRSQFNGGGGQRFEVSYKRSDSTARGWVYKKVDEDPGVGHTVYAQISGLVKNTGYDVRVQAISTQTDSLKSNFTEELFVFVEDPVTSSDIGVGAGIGIGITVALVVAGLCLTGYYVWRTKRTNDPHLKDPQCRSDIALPTQNSTLSSQPRKNSNPYNATEKPSPACPLSPSVTRPSIPRPPVPGSHAPHTPSLPRSAAPLPPTANTRKKDKSVALPSPPPDEVYEAVETEPDGGEYVAPIMHYQNM